MHRQLITFRLPYHLLAVLRVSLLYYWLFGGDSGIRTHNLLLAKQLRSQLRHTPMSAVVSGLERYRKLRESTSMFPTSAILHTLPLAKANPELRLKFLGSPPRGRYRIRSTLIYLGSCLPRLYRVDSRKPRVEHHITVKVICNALPRRARS